MTHRPLGLVAIAVLQGAVGVVFLLIGSVTGILSPFVGGIFGSLVEAAARVIFVSFVAFGVVFLCLALGIWMMKGWALSLSKFFASVGLVLSLICTSFAFIIGLVGAVLNGAILLYVVQPFVKGYFQK